MALTLDKDIEHKLTEYPQIIERLESFAREQIALEEWRKKRFSKEARDIVDQAIEEASQETISREDAFKDLSRCLEQIADIIPDEAA